MPDFTVPDSHGLRMNDGPCSCHVLCSQPLSPLCLLIFSQIQGSAGAWPDWDAFMTACSVWTINKALWFGGGCSSCVVPSLPLWGHIALQGANCTLLRGNHEKGCCDPMSPGGA